MAKTDDPTNVKAPKLSRAERKRLRAAAKPRPSHDPESLRALTDGSRRFGAFIAILFFGIGGIWASFAPIASAALAPGTVSPEGSRRTVQHLEGGIIEAIHVADGDYVEKGDPLITLRDTRARAERDVAADQYIGLRATEARLQAELLGQESFEFPPNIRARVNDLEIANILETQRALFTTRTASRISRTQILNQQIEQLKKETQGLDGVIRSQNVQLTLIREELVGTQELYDKGLTPITRLNALKRAKAELEGARESSRARIARNEQSIGEIELRLINLAEEDQKEINTTLEDTRARIASIENQLPAYEDVLDRTVVTAPVSGRVVELRFTSMQGVVRPGEGILDIVPDEADLLIDAQVKPSDIDTVAPGLPAQVLLTAYGQRNMPRIMGEVRTISADRIVDERSGLAYYLARVAVSREELDRIGEDVELVSGMPADVMILTGSRTFLEYLFDPIAKSFDRSFRET